jgi:hypothetical protein
MAILKILGTTWMLLVVAAFTLALLQGGSSDAPIEPTRDNVPTDFATAEMLDSDIGMLEQMRAWVSPSMTGMIATDPMWVDPGMIRAQEQYQAQIDRMLARG